MVDKVIEEQLKKVQYADLSNFDEKTNTYIIKKKVDLKLEEDHYYIIQVKDDFLKNCKNDVITINWNAGKYPKSQYYKVDVTKVMGKMARVNGTAYNYDTKEDLEEFFSGWFSLNCIIVLEEI